MLTEQFFKNWKGDKLVNIQCDTRFVDDVNDDLQYFIDAETGMLWMIFINWMMGFTAVGIGSAVIVITMLIALVYYMWEVYHDGKA